jgi:glucose-1-phosphate thymidylyltransferase
MKGIILAGGSGTRLRPMTACVNKHLLPVYDKPMVFYPLATLMQAGIRDILLITTPADKPMFETLLGNGQSLGLSISYAMQPRPEGIAQAFIIGKEFINGEPCALVLGDNIFHGTGMQPLLDEAAQRKNGASVFAIEVSDPHRFGVVEFDRAGQPAEIIEKPAAPLSKWAVAGLYFYDTQVVSIAENLKPSKRGELEITDLNRAYLDKGELFVQKMDETIAWLDTGTPDSLLQAASYVQIAEKKGMTKIACLEEIAWKQGFITTDAMLAAAAPYAKTPYGEYLVRRGEAEDDKAASLTTRRTG